MAMRTAFEKLGVTRVFINHDLYHHRAFSDLMERLIHEDGYMVCTVLIDTCYHFYVDFDDEQEAIIFKLKL
jgi:hypothetical protein